MIEITDGKQCISVKVKAGDIISITYNQVESINISNYTDGSIFVSEENDFTFNNSVGNFLTITDGNSYNEYLFYKSGKNTIYIKCDADGVISIMRKQW